MLPASVRDSSKSQIQRFVLARLARMLWLEDEWRAQSRRTDWRFRLIQKGIYSTYRDCLAEGIAAQARELIDRHRAGESA